MHPIFLAILYPVDMVARNGTVFAPSDAIRSSLVLAALALLSVVLLYFSHTNFRGLAAIVGMVFLSPFVGQHDTVSRVAFFFIVLLLSLVALRRGIGPRGTAILNAAAAALLVMPFVTIVAHQKAFRADGTLPYSPFNRVVLAPVTNDPPPIIAHIVLDGYAANHVLESVFGFDNSGFTRSLQGLGFTVFEDARSPYSLTLFSMGAIFAGTYLREDYAPVSLNDDDLLRIALGRIVTSGPLRRKLETLGYRFTFTDTGYNAFQYSAGDKIVAPGRGVFEMTPFESHLVESAGALDFLHQTDHDRGLGAAERRNTLVRYALGDHYLRLRSPFYLYEHVLTPHPPFTMDRHGRSTSKWLSPYIGDGDHATQGKPELIAEYKVGYLEKLRYTNRAVLRQVQTMIREIRGAKVIMIHGDHGSGAHLFLNDMARTCAYERLSPFLAVYSDDARIREAFAEHGTDRFNLVNLYRVLLDARYETGLGLLEDQSYFVPWDSPQRPRRLTAEQLDSRCKAEDSSVSVL
jgi:hypothetical protein